MVGLGAARHTSGFAGDPVGIRDGIGRLTVFARGFNGAAYVSWQGAAVATGWAAVDRPSTAA